MAPVLFKVVVLLSTFAANDVLGNKAQSNTDNSREADNHGSSSTVGNIAFDLPDLTVTVSTPSGTEYHIDAFKSSKNDEIFNRLDTSRVSQVFWVSVGKPNLVKTLDQSTSPPSVRFFHSSHEGFYTFVEMLTPSQRQLLAVRASVQYGVNVSDFQIANLPLSSFECTIKFEDKMGIPKPLVGRVTDFRTFPFRLDFRASHHKEEFRLFQERINRSKSEEDADLQFACRMRAQGRTVRTNTLTIELQQLERFGIIDKLFGPTSTTPNSSSTAPGRLDAVYVTRDQVTALSADIYSRLNIFENYEMPESQFSDEFVKDLITQVAVGHFTLVPIDDVLNTLSNYALDFADDIVPDKIKRDLGSLLVIQKVDDKSRIILNETTYDNLERQVDPQRGGTKAKRLGIEGTAEWAKKNGERPIEAETRTLNEQLNELNSASYTDTKWLIEGDRVIPKSLNVIKFSRSNIGREMTFNRVKRNTIDAPFDNQFTLYTRTMIRTGTSPSTALPPVVETGSKQSMFGSQPASGNRQDIESMAMVMSETVVREINDLRNEWRSMIVDVARSVQLLKEDVERLFNRTAAFNCRPTSSPSDNPDARNNRPSAAASQARQLMSVDSSSPLPEGRCVFGIASFNGRIYVGRALSRELEIYDTQTLALQRRLPVSDLGCITDMTSRPGAVVMYVVDNCNDLIHVIDDAGVRRRWSVEETPRSASVTAVGSNVLITFEENGPLREYTPDGDLVREIRLQQGLSWPTHAIQLGDGRYVVSQGSHGVGTVHRVSLVDERGRLLTSFGSEEGAGNTRMRIPMRMVSSYGQLLVVDSQNDRVIMLNSTSLAYVQQVISEPTISEFLIRIALSENGGRLFVAHNNFRAGLCLTGHVKTYNLSWM